VTVVSSGKTSVPVVTYSTTLKTPGTDESWKFHAKAANAGTVTLPYDWTGFHSYFQATAHLAAYVTHVGVTTTTPLVNAGPSNCCTAPSGGFHYTGTVRLHVAAGDVYGFKFGGTNSDSNPVLQGRLALGPTTATMARALADASGGGLVYDVAVSVAAVPPWAGTPGGSVTVSEGSTVLGTGFVSGGQGSVQVTVAAAGAHTLIVTYGGERSFATSSATATTSGAYDVAAGQWHSLALKSDGTAVAWGCGNGTDFGQCSVPTGLTGLSAIAAGEADSLALKSDGTVVAWGCGNGSYGACTVPTGLTGVSAIAAGAFHSLALKSDGTVVAWGCANVDFGQCTVPAGLRGVTAVAAGTYHSLALKSDGTAVAWGCGNGTDFGQCTVPTGLSGVTAVAAGWYHSLALKSDGTAVAWGCGNGADFGQCTVPAGLNGVTAVAAGYSHSLALKSDGTVVAWGCGGGNDYGQCTVPAGLSGVIAIAAGEYHSLALKSDGTVVAWGCGGGFNLGQCTVPPLSAS
jgi:hypothetical protein